MDTTIIVYMSFIITSNSTHSSEERIPMSSVLHTVQVTKIVQHVIENHIYLYKDYPL
jgi:hypothetical protein